MQNYFTEILDNDGRAFLELAQNGDLLAMIDFHSEHLDNFEEIINTRNSTGKTGLMLAIENEHPELAEWLIDQGAEVDLKDQFDITASTSAITKGYYQLIEKITERAGAFYIVDDIFDAIKINKDEVADLIIATVIEKRTDIWPNIAVTLFNNELIYSQLSEERKQLIIEIIEGNAGYLLKQYVKNNDLEQTKRVLKISNNVIDKVDELNFTALSYAALMGNSEIVRLLIKYGADANITNNADCVNSDVLNSPLSFAIENNNRENIRILLPKTNLENIQSAIFLSLSNKNGGLETLIEIAQESESPEIWSNVDNLLENFGYFADRSPSNSPIRPDSSSGKLSPSIKSHVSTIEL